jgi:hypothetical protein
LAGKYGNSKLDPFKGIFNFRNIKGTSAALFDWERGYSSTANCFLSKGTEFSTDRSDDR